MGHAPDQLSTLLCPEMIPHLEQMNMSYLGYYLLRENITQKLLGESEAPILYWIGKDIGKQMTIASLEDLTMQFIRLGFGKLEIRQEKSNHYVCMLINSIYPTLSKNRLQRSLSLETGMVAGALGNWLHKPTEAKVEIIVEQAGKKVEAKITVTIQK